MSEHGAAATVDKWDKDRVLVSIPMVGFPAGYELRPGEQVMVMLENSGLVARPLVKMAVVNETCQALAASGKVDINGVPHTLQSASVCGTSDPSTPSADVFIVESGTASGPQQIVATRPR